MTKLSGNANIPVEQTPEYQSALATLNNALRDQRDSVVHAPFSGYVTEVDQLQPGMYLAAGTAAFGLVSDRHIWVTAQPKENDLTWVRPGQPVAISVDTYPGQTWHGVVAEPEPGQRFGILHPAGTKFLRQLGEGGAAHPGAGRDRLRAAKPAAA